MGVYVFHNHLYRMSFESSDGQNQSKELQKNLEKKGVSGEFTEQELTNIGDLGLNFKKE